MREPKKYITAVRHALVRFLEHKECSVLDFCVETNAWLIRNGYNPVEKTPFRHPGDIERLFELRNGDVYHYGSNNRVM